MTVQFASTKPANYLIYCCCTLVFVLYDCVLVTSRTTVSYTHLDVYKRQGLGHPTEAKYQINKF